MIVCLCRGVNDRAIAAAVAAGADSPAALGACCGAGTDCGRCRPELARLCRQAREERAAAGGDVEVAA